MKLCTILIPLLWVLCSFALVDAAFLSLVVPVPQTGLACNTATSPPASGCLYVSTSTGFCFGEFTVANANQKIPIIIRYDNATQTWCRGLYSNAGGPYSSKANGTIYAVGYDTQAQTLYAVGSADNGAASTNYWSNYTQQGFQKNYGTGGGKVVSVLLKINPVSSVILAATFLHSISSNGDTNSLKVTGLGLADNGNVIVTADSADLPPGQDGSQPIPSSCVSYSAPLQWTAELSFDLSQVESFCIDPAKYVAASGCFDNTCPGTKQQTTVVATQNNEVFTSNISLNGESTFSSKSDSSAPPFTYKLASLIERDPSGNAVKTFEAFSGLQYTLVSNGTTTFQGISVQRVKLTTTFPVATFVSTGIQVDYYIFLEEGTVTWGSETFNVSSDTLKNTVTLSDWPFASSSNTLELKIQGLTVDGDVAWDDTSKTGTFSAGAKMVFATSANYDNDATNAPVGVTGSVSGLTLSVLINFNSFTTSVAYDPQLVVTPTSSSGSSSAASQIKSFWL